jgi:hypothetical protein
MIHVVLLQPGPGHNCPPDAIVLELAPAEVYSLESAREYWAPVDESTSIVVAFVPLEVSNETAEHFEQLRSVDGPEKLEEVLNAVFNLGRAFQQE